MLAALKITWSPLSTSRSKVRMLRLASRPSSSDSGMSTSVSTSSFRAASTLKVSPSAFSVPLSEVMASQPAWNPDRSVSASKVTSAAEPAANAPPTGIFAVMSLPLPCRRFSLARQVISRVKSPAWPGKRAAKVMIGSVSDEVALAVSSAAVPLYTRATYNCLPPLPKKFCAASAVRLSWSLPSIFRSLTSPKTRSNSAKLVTTSGVPRSGPVRVGPTIPATLVPTPSMDLAR